MRFANIQSALLLLALVGSCAVLAATVCQASTPSATAPESYAADGAEAQEAQPARFQVLEIRVLGSRVLPPENVERAVYPYLGPDRTFADIEAARVALETAYRDAGFGTVFVDIPPQEVGSDGVVRLQVTESPLFDVSLQGGRYFARRDVAAALPAASEGTVPHLPSLQSQLARLNAQTPDRTVVPVLKAGPVPGTVDLDLRIDDRLPFHGSIELNDQYTADTTRLRSVASLRYDNFFGRLDSLSLQYQTAPEEPSEVGVLAASYLARLDDSRRLALFYVDSNNDVATVGTLAVLGSGQVFGARLIQTLETTPTRTQTLTLGLDYKDFREDIRLDPEQAIVTPIKYLHASAAYAGAWRGETRRFDMSVSAGMGFRGLVNDAQEFADKRFRARPNYFYLRADGALSQQLPGDFTLDLRVSGQAAAEPLISNEQYALGGAGSIRGYLEAEELGDVGIHGTIEFGTPLWRAESPSATARLFVFTDLGVVGIIQPLPDEPTRTDLSSAGAGINFSLLGWLSGSLTWAYPLVPAGRTLDGDSRVLFMVRGEW